MTVGARLTQTEIDALDKALDDEYQAWATYDQVITDFGPIRPFIRIREAEARHIDALLNLFRKYDLPIPDNGWPGRVPRYPNPTAACAAGVAAEIANGAMYDRLISCTRRPDLLTVLRNLKDASQQRHLPAFQRCLARASGGGGGRNRRRRHGDREFD